MSKGRKRVAKTENESILDLSRLVEPVPEKIDKDLLCQICLDIVQHPQECSNCQTVYCMECIKDWKKSKNECPNRCTGKWQLSEPHKKYKNELSNLKFKCRYADKGCQQLVTFDNYLSHEKECQTKQPGNAQTKSQSKDTATSQSNDGQENTSSAQQKDASVYGFFCWKGDNGNWVVCDKKDSDLMEQNYQKKKLKFFMKIGQWEYDIDLEKMKQINRSSKRERDMKRFERKIVQKSAQSKQPEEEKKKVEDPKEDKAKDESESDQQNQQQQSKKKEADWLWLDSDHGKHDWNKYTDGEVVKVIENGYQGFLQNSRRKAVLFKLNGKQYQINFQNMKQTNVQTSYSRDVKRQEQK